MPGWHAKTKNLRKNGKLQVAGIIEEQHPDRCRLFMQWQQMGWPVLVDSLNLLGVGAVPQTYLIDEYGFIRYGPRIGDDDLSAFIKTEYQPPPGQGSVAELPNLDAIIRNCEDADAVLTSKTYMEYGDALFRRGHDADFSRAIEAYRAAVKLGGPPTAAFRLGVTLRRRFETKYARDEDFQDCIDSWKEALDQEPNQYIWRRRIQQYGPRLDKPYSFYDWVHKARRDIRQRGESPAPLLIEPTGAEFAHVLRSFKAAQTTIKEPDPDGRLLRDKAPLIDIRIAVAPATGHDQNAARAHLAFVPNEDTKGHWNNEAELLSVWLNPPEGVSVDRQQLTAVQPQAPVSTEIRRVEFEVHWTNTGARIPGYALYYVCEGVNGQCLYLRQDFNVLVTTK